MREDIAEREAADGEDAGLEPRQIAALERLHEMGAAPRKDGEKYSSDRKVRMQQLIYEGRAGGPQANSGRRKSRAGAAVADHISNYLTPKIKKALDDGLTDEEIAIRLKTVDLALKIEREEASLQLREEQTDLDNADKEQLIAALISLARDPESAAALEAAVIELPESEYEEVTNGDNGSTAVLEAVGVDDGQAGSNGRERLAGYREERPNPFTQAARRGTANRRRAS